MGMPKSLMQHQQKNIRDALAKEIARALTAYQTVQTANFGLAVDLDPTYWERDVREYVDVDMCGLRVGD
jgi:hypothetical protein